jgi:hypothetical protein
VVAGSAADAGEGVILLDYSQGFAVPTFCDKCDVALRSLPSRTSAAAGGDPKFIDGISVGDSLRIKLISRTPLRQSLVECIGENDWTHICAVATTDALVEIHISGFAAQ